MGAHSIPQTEYKIDLQQPRDVSLTLEERGYLREMLTTYRNMFAEQMVALKYNNSTDMQKREAFREKQLSYADSLMNKLRSAES